jgi:hypothetical protein
VAHDSLVKHLLDGNLDGNEEEIIARLRPDDLETLRRNWEYDFLRCRGETGLYNVWQSMVLMAREPLRFWAQQSEQHACVIRRMLPEGIDVDVSNVESYLRPSDFEMLYRNWGFPFQERDMWDIGSICDGMFKDLDRENGIPWYVSHE